MSFLSSIFSNTHFFGHRYLKLDEEYVYIIHKIVIENAIHSPLSMHASLEKYTSDMPIILENI